MSPASQFFLVWFDRVTSVSEVEPLGRDAATAAARLQEAERRAGSDTEVGLLHADSVETLKRTHSSYFGATDSLFASLRG